MGRPSPGECNDATSMWLMDEEWADGILRLHAECEPPCPRKQVALRFKQQVSGR